jgi:3-hydroxy-9,10-secoandrosta-1,3,5(10)-triene-9,17-dione monooxygenase
MTKIHKPDFSRGKSKHQEIDAIEQAERMIPALRQNAQLARELRRVPDETREMLRASGLARILQPRRVGGSEMPLVSLLDVLLPIGAGCGSTAWVLAQYLIHNYMIARWPEEAQEKIWSRPDALISGILVPLHGKAHRTTDGYLLSGHWSLVSGVHETDWCILSATTTGVKGPGEDCNFVVPTSSIEILNTWNPIGLHGSGSDDVQVRDLFVPDHMVLPVKAVNSHDAPGCAVNPGSIYRLPCYMIFGTLLASTVLGMAEQMFEEFLTYACSRTSVMNAAPVGSFATSHLDVGEISAILQASEALLRADLVEMTEIAEAGRTLNDKQRSNYRCNAAFAARCASRTASLIIDLLGGPAASDANFISRIHQDIFVATRHSNLNWNANVTDHGRARFRMSLSNTAL